MTSPADEAVAVTGLGLSTALGFGVGHNWERLLAGDSAVRVLPPEHFVTPLALPVRLGAPIDRDELAERIRAAVPRQVWNTSAEVCHLWLLTALEALAQAGLDKVDADSAPPARRERIGIYVGNGAGAAHLTEREFANVYTAEKAAFRDVSRMVVPKYMTSSLAGQLSLLTGFRGPALALNTACSSGLVAVLTALDALRAGRIDAAVVGGAEMALTATVLKGFANLGALASEHALGPAACRPFDAARTGFVLGEGAGALVLERAGSARARGATPLALLLGGAASAEAHHLLAPEPEGAGMVRCIALALADARLPAEAVGHVFAHGTGTQDNDRCEAAALHGICPHGPSVSATKALLGHAIGAAGAMDAVLAVLALGSGRVVPCINLDTPDAACPVRAARAPDDAPALARGGAVMVNSFAFGGHNAVALFGPPAGARGATAQGAGT